MWRFLHRARVTFEEHANDPREHAVEYLGRTVAYCVQANLHQVMLVAALEVDYQINCIDSIELFRSPEQIAFLFLDHPLEIFRLARKD